ncbi:hypothetical protein QYM36_015892 [Artemia franciscana]|uniref:Exostosin-2 n=2 Tax=Artemia franciscana TaxID=6661 RepID=A0AA88HAZ7_ARTSF|nr:hypothetical protein QYM36_015892 [Artemia franciscana]
MLPGSSPDFIPKLEVDTGFALVAGGGFNAYTFRYSYDISIPVYSPWISSSKIHADSDRKWFIISSQPYLTKKSFEIMMTVAKEHKDILIAQACSENSNLSTGSWRCNKDGVLFKNPEFLQEGEFCLVFRGARLGQPVLIETLASGCIPVIVIDKYVLPFSDVLEWKRAAILLYEHQLPDIYVILKSLNPERIQSLKEHGRYFFDQYLGSMKKIGLTTLDIISERVYPLQSKGYDGWNVLPKSMSKPNVFILPMGPPKSQGFTAVVLTYNRLESLYAIIRNLAATPSLVHIVVVWNNQLKAPPSRDQWPEIRKPLTIIRSSKNILTNRFLPFKEIQTEAVLSLDDDINMLTIDELEFGYQVWREFPDRIVGFPSRTHTWSNISNSWVYDSEWGNSYSLVLTGASFYHKYWHHIYATDLPPAVKKFVDDHMNCEDIAMNFLVANKTGKSPIKVGPRKKFKCPSCTSEMLSADAGHLAERSLCVDYFSKEFGKLELKYAEFRADPVLYREDVPEDFKIYGNMGSL